MVGSSLLQVGTSHSNRTSFRGLDQLFFLRCLAEAPELEVLLRREIAAREIFLVCDSPAARASLWVRREQDFIRGLNGKLIKVLPIHASLEERTSIIDSISHRASFYLSCARGNYLFATRLKEYLKAHDYAVADWADSVVDSIGVAMRAQMQAAFESGGIILLLCPRSGQYAWSEVADILACYDAASSPDKRIIAFVTHDYRDFQESIPDSLRSSLSRFRLEDISHLTLEDQERHILARIRAGNT